MTFATHCRFYTRRKLQNAPTLALVSLTSSCLRAYAETPFNVITLKSALRLATKFGHPAMRAFALAHPGLENLEPIERIVISRESNVPTWMERGLRELCARDEPISLAEAQMLGLETFVEVAAKRETQRSKLGLGLVAFKEALYNTNHPTIPSGSELSCNDFLETSTNSNSSGEQPRYDAPHGSKSSSLAHIITAAFSAVDSVVSSTNE
jgi:hypothetical protein